MPGIIKFNAGKLAAKKTQKPSILSAVAPRRKVAKNSVLEKFNERNKKVHIVYGLDYTASTSDVVAGFKENAENICKNIKGKFNADQYFGVCNERFHISEKNDFSFLERAENVYGWNLILRFIRSTKNSFAEQEGAKILVIFADGLEDDESYQETVSFLKKNNVHLFFVYQEYDGSSNKEEIISSLIEPLGEQGIFLDIKSLEKIPHLIQELVGYSVQASQSKTGKPKISFQKFLQGKSCGNLAITQGNIRALAS